MCAPFSPDILQVGAVKGLKIIKVVATAFSMHSFPTSKTNLMKRVSVRDSQYVNGEKSKKQE